MLIFDEGCKQVSIFQLVLLAYPLRWCLMIVGQMAFDDSGWDEVSGYRICIYKTCQGVTAAACAVRHTVAQQLTATTCMITDNFGTLLGLVGLSIDFTE